MYIIKKYLLQVIKISSLPVSVLRALESVSMVHPGLLRVVESVCQPLLLQQLVPVFAEVQRLSTPKRERITV